MKRKSFLLLALLSSHTLFAENHMLVVGGGGEPTGNTTIFDTGIKTLGKNVKNSSWKYQVSFNGGHSKTESILEDEFKNPISPTTDFTAENYNLLIRDYKAKILSGEIGPGDQLMIIIDTHGAAKVGSGKTHKVAASGGAADDLNNLAGTKLVSLDDLEDLVILTNEKGINLGIIDLSCHSGNTMELKKNAPNTCIVTATGPVHYGYAGPTAFTDKFLSKLKPGTNLETAFLKARSEATDPSFPMISTEENDEIVAEVYKSITPYLYYYDAKADKMTSYIQANANEQMICKRDEQFNDLISKIEMLQGAARGRNGYDGADLKKLLTDYKKLQDNILTTANALGGSYLDKRETFSTPVNFKSTKPIPPASVDFTWRQMLNLNPESTIDYFEGRKKVAKTPREKAEAQAVIDTYKNVKIKRDQIMSTYPRIKEYEGETVKLTQQLTEGRALADKIVVEEKKFYDELYSHKQKPNTNDPCRKIVF
jgi:hypothetical protein